MVRLGKSKFWSFKAAADDPKVGELLLYGVISSTTWWGDEITPKQFKQDLDALGDIDELKVFINSDGGDVFAGQAIHSMLKRHKATVTVYIDGLAASIASVIAMAGDVVRMPRNAMIMVHNPWAFMFGGYNAEDLRKMANDLDKARESILVTYEDKTGMERDELIKLCDAETWLTAEEAVDKGFADEIEETKQVAASLSAGHLVVNGLQFDLSRFRNAPKLAFIPPAPAAPSQSVSETQADSGLLSLWNRRLQLNRNRIRGGTRA